MDDGPHSIKYGRPARACAQGGGGAQWAREHGMSDSEEATPEVAPAHTDVRTSFSQRDLAIVVGLGALAIIAGTVLGLIYTT